MNINTGGEQMKRKQSRRWCGLTVFALCLSLAGCRTAPTSTQTGTSSDNAVLGESLMRFDATGTTDAEFIEQLLREDYARAISNNVPLVIERELTIDWVAFDFDSTTECSAAMITLAESKDQRLGEAARDFCEKNRSTHTLDSIGHLNIKHVVWSRELYKAICDGPGDSWEEFYRKYPDSPGIISISRPGFSKDGSIAIICIANQSGGVCGEGRIVVLEKKGSKWIETGRFKSVFGGGWIS